MSSKLKITEDGAYLINITLEPQTLSLIKKLPHNKSDSKVAAVHSMIECPVCYNQIGYLWTQFNGIEKAICATAGCIHYKLAIQPCFPLRYSSEEKELINNQPRVKRVKRIIAEPAFVPRVRKARRLFEI